MKKLFGVVLLVLSLGAWAGTSADAVASAGWKSLSETQRAEILKQVATQAEANSKVSPENIMPEPAKVDEWVAIGERIGKMMSGAAREVGMALNEFMNTPVGMITMGLIIWKVMGGALLHMVGGFMVWIIGAVVMSALYRRFTPTETTYDMEKTNWFGNHPKVRTTRASLRSEEAWGVFLGTAVFTAAGIIVMFTG